jgi:glycosyltransferase involved in cell wall biosynthesis
MREKMEGNTFFNDDCILTVVTPISGTLTDFSKMQETLKTAYGFPIKFRYVIDTPSKERAEEIKSLLLNPLSNHPEFQFVDVSAPGSARNFGLIGLQTEWVTFWDADDAPNVVEFLKMVNAANENGFEMCLGDYAVFADQDRKFLYKSEVPKTFPQLGKCLGVNPGIWRFGFKSSRLGSIQFCDLKMAEDQLFLAEINLHKSPIYLSSLIVYNYYTGGKSHLTKDKQALRQLPIASRKLLKLLDQSPDLISDFTTIMLSRQTLTSIKKAPILSKLSAILLGLNVIFFKDSIRKLFLTSILYVAVNSKEYICEAT